MDSGTYRQLSLHWNLPFLIYFQIKNLQELANSTTLHNLWLKSYQTWWDLEWLCALKRPIAHTKFKYYQVWMVDSRENWICHLEEQKVSLTEHLQVTSCWSHRLQRNCAFCWLSASTELPTPPPATSSTSPPSASSSRSSSLSSSVRLWTRWPLSRKSSAISSRPSQEATLAASQRMTRRTTRDSSAYLQWSWNTERIQSVNGWLIWPYHLDNWIT